jgi:hypothetical protein
MEEFNERDLFAALAMVGMIIRTPSGEWADDYVVGSAYELADAMMKEKEKRDESAR